MNSAFSSFLELEVMLAEWAPNEIQEAKNLHDELIDPTTADVETVWPTLWTKPLYANARVSAADVWRLRLEPFMGEAWKIWGKRDFGFAILKSGKGVSSRSYELQGNLAKHISKESGVALFRLHRIQGAAIALRARVANCGDSYPMADLPEMTTHQQVEMLRTELGTGWGPVTVLHLLTDLGLACKPDLHLMATVRYLGLDQDVVAGCGVTRGTIHVVERLKEFRRELEQKTGRAWSLRYLDKVLMEISRQGLLSISPALRTGQVARG